MKHVLIEAAHLAGGLLTVALITEVAAWSYPLGREPIAWIGRVAAVAVVLWSVPLFRTALARDRAGG